MDQQKIDMYIMANQKNFPADKIYFLKERLSMVDDQKFALVSTVPLKDPTTLLIVSLLIGGLGVDRFMVGDIGMGVLKLLTCGCCGIMTIIDWFTIQNKAREVNFQNVMALL